MATRLAVTQPFGTPVILTALNSTSGVQVVQVKATAQPEQGRIDFRWTTQREHPFQGFNVFRAPDVGNAPGTYTQLNGGLIAPAYCLGASSRHCAPAPQVISGICRSRLS